MAKDKEILNKVLKQPSASDEISRMVEDQTEIFPSVSDIQVSHKWVDPFEVPKWCNQKEYAFGWIDPKDDIQKHRAFDEQHFKIVTRVSSCIKGKITERDFRDHGAVERQGMILVFRPIDLDAKMRTFPVSLHTGMVDALRAGKSERLYGITNQKFSDSDQSSEARAAASGSGIDVYAYEEAGEQAKTASDLKAGDLQGG
jgi:hypothetical protein